MTWLLSILGWAIGLRPAQVARVELVALPATRRLLALDRTSAPLVEQALALIKQALPLIDEALPLIGEANKEIALVAPVFADVLAALERHLAIGRTHTDAVAAIRAAIAQCGPRRREETK